MNPHRRVGVMPEDQVKSPPPYKSLPEVIAITVPSDSPVNDKADEVIPPTIEPKPDAILDEPIPYIHELRVPNELPLNCPPCPVLLELNAGLAIAYTVIGSIMFLISICYQPQNRMIQRYCYRGYCTSRDFNYTSMKPSFLHGTSTPDSFHPYDWFPLVASFALICHGLIVWSKLSIGWINSGHMLNWVTVIFSITAAVRGLTHLGDPNLTITWAEGVFHSVLMPVLWPLVATATIVQFLLNLPTLVLHHPNYYAELALYSTDDHTNSGTTSEVTTRTMDSV